MKYKKIPFGERTIYCSDQFDIYIEHEQQDEKVLFSDDDNIEFVEWINRPIKKPSKLKKLIILASTACNLRCRYCYLNYGKHEGEEVIHNIQVASAKKAIDIILEQYPDGIGFIQFFGGEPLVAFPEIKEIYTYICDKFLALGLIQPQFGMVTNGLLLNDEIISFLNESKISVTMSVDGDQKIHDLVRLKINETSAFLDIKEKMRQYKDRVRFPLFYEMTLNREHVLAYEPGKMKEWLTAIKELGFTGGIIGIVEFSRDSLLDFREEDIPILKKMYQEYVKFYFDELLDENSNFYNLDICKMILFILKKDLKFYSCNVGIGQLTLGTNGSFYPCPKFATIDFKLGSVEEGDFHQEEIAKVIESDKRENCQNCWMRYMCKSYCFSLKYRNIDKRKVIPIRCIHLENMMENVIINVVEAKEKGQLVSLVKKVQQIYGRIAKVTM